MTALQPLWFRWSGSVMAPLNPRAAARQYVAGENYYLDHREDRSTASHRHYFAALNAAWQTLPDDLADRFPTVEHMRKAALIRAGYRDERSIVASSRAEAQRIAAFIRPMDEYAVVSVAGASVIVLTAKSQSMRSMGKADFEDSKRKVLEIVAEMIGTSTRALTEEAA